MLNEANHLWMVFECKAKWIQGMWIEHGDLDLKYDYDSHYNVEIIPTSNVVQLGRVAHV